MAVICLMPAQAYAYFDPGTGSYLFQLFVATVFGTLIAVRGFIKHAIQYFFSNLKSKTITNQEKSHVQSFNEDLEEETTDIHVFKKEDLKKKLFNQDKELH